MPVIIMKKYIALFERLLIAVGHVMKILPKSFGEPQTVTNSVILTISLDKKNSVHVIYRQDEFSYQLQHGFTDCLKP